MLSHFSLCVWESSSLHILELYRLNWQTHTRHKHTVADTSIANEWISLLVFHTQFKSTKTIVFFPWVEHADPVRPIYFGIKLRFLPLWCHVSLSSMLFIESSLLWWKRSGRTLSWVGWKEWPWWEIGRCDIRLLSSSCSHATDRRAPRKQDVCHDISQLIF